MRTFLFIAVVGLVLAVIMESVNAAPTNGQTPPGSPKDGHGSNKSPTTPHSAGSPHGTQHGKSLHGSPNHKKDHENEFSNQQNHATAHPSGSPKKVSGDHLKAILERIGQLEKQLQQQTKATAGQLSKILEKIGEMEKQNENTDKENCWDAFYCHKGIEISGDKSLIVRQKGNTLVGASPSDYGIGDTVGIGVHLATRKMIFTKNGLRLDNSDFFVDPSFADGSLYPFVSLLGSGDNIEANFGPNFKFDLATL